MERLADIAKRNRRALRDTRIKLMWVGLIFASLIAIYIGLQTGLAKPHVTPHAKRLPPAPATRVDGVLLR